jgi:glycosyltransferase involved in cell wall biosynthesis
VRILTISNCPLSEHQGSGYVIVNFARGLKARGHHVDLLGPEDFEPLRGLRRAKSYRQAIGMLALALQRVARTKYDVVEFYGSEACLAAWVLAALPRREFLMTAHSNGLEPFVHDRLNAMLGSSSLDGTPLRWYQSGRFFPIENAFRKVDAIVTVSEIERSYALEHRYQDESHIAAIENPLPEEFLGQSICSERDRVIGYCGSWLARKGAQMIERELPRILEEFPDWRAKVIGVGPRFRKEEHFPAAVLPRIEVIPFVDHKEQLREVYHSLAILMMPSIYESFGLVLAEGMACGCAAVAGRTGFGCSLKDGEEAILIDERAASPLYDALRRLMIDDPLRRHIAEAGYARVQSLRWPAAIDRLECLYQRWLAELRQK